MTRVSQGQAARRFPGFVFGRYRRAARPLAPVRRLTPEERAFDVALIDADFRREYAAHVRRNPTARGATKAPH